MVVVGLTEGGGMPHMQSPPVLPLNEGVIRCSKSKSELACGMLRINRKIDAKK